MRENALNDIDELPTLEEIKHVLQQSVLTDYPNPERKGCLESQSIGAVAQQRLPHQATEWQHIRRCSPCYREFLDFRKDFKRQRNARIRRWQFAWAFLILSVVLLAYWCWPL